MNWISRAATTVAAVLALCSASWAQTGFSSPASHALIMDSETGITLHCQRCTEPMPPASMSKLMTILLVAEALEAGQITEDTRFRVSERAWRRGAVSDGSHMFLELNSDVRVGDLLRGAIIVSANDACIALAEGLAGSEEQFVDRMNRRAVALGLSSARFRNSTGLPEPDHVISAYDLARLTRQIITRHPQIYRLYSERSFTFNNRTQENRNPLLGLFPGADGVKTGHTNASGYGLVGAAVLNGRRRIIVFNGMRSMAERRAEADRMMRAAFYDFRVYSLYPQGATVGEAEVWLGGRKRVPLVTQRPIAIGLANSARPGVRAAIVYQGPIRAPVAEGQEVAKLVVEGPSFPRREFPLVAGRRVGRANPFARAWAGFSGMFGE
jgi:D-alanyl-D-alanine carboxypeptidase (penicillin-binding protein 5/6)